MKIRTSDRTDGFTLVEVMLAASIGGVVALFIGAFLSGSALLFAKNISTNMTHNSTRSALDRLAQDITQADGAVSLITATGAPVASGQAAGIEFDVLRANPYVLAHPGGAGLSATATTFTLKRTTNAVAMPPLPSVDDVIIADDAATVRLKVQTTTPVVPVVGSVQDVAVNLQSAAGTAIPWASTSIKGARVVRRVAYVVVPSGGKNELRYFPAAENIANFSTAPGYTLVLRNLASASGDETPFSYQTFQGKDFLRFVMRVRSDRYDQRLLRYEKNQFSSIQRIDFLLSPRGG